MRTSPLVGDRAWFGPRRFGWGLGPVSKEGWVVSGAAAVLSLVAARAWPSRPLLRRLPMIVLVAVAVAKGTAPGGRKSRAELLASVDPAP